MIGKFSTLAGLLTSQRYKQGCEGGARDQKVNSLFQVADVDTSVISWINADEVSEVLWSMADGWSDHLVWNWASEATACTEATSPLSEVQINCEQGSPSPGAQ